MTGNSFEIALHEVTDTDAVVERLQAVKAGGVPNYYGSQRFGRNGNNISEARRWGKDNVRSRNQNQRSLYLSAARSWIFNQIVSQRIEQGCFAQLLIGDLLEGGEQLLNVTAENIAQLSEQLVAGKVAITAALAGDNALPTQEQALELEQTQLDNEPDMMKLIRSNRMRHDRRAITLMPQQMSWQVDGNTVIVAFMLPAGGFATSVLREVVEEIPQERVFD